MIDTEASLQAALDEGVAWMEMDEGNEDHVFEHWLSIFSDVIDYDLLVTMFDPEDEDWRKQYMILAVLGNTEDERYWDIFLLAYAEGDDTIQLMGMWAMEHANKKRYKLQIGLDNFFDALARYAELMFNEQGGQLTLF